VLASEYFGKRFISTSPGLASGPALPDLFIPAGDHRPAA
jgi:hypothetical protein